MAKTEKEKKAVEQQTEEAAVTEAETPDSSEAAETAEAPAEGSTEGAPAEEGSADAPANGKKSLFGKKKEKAEKPDPLKEQIKELQDKCMRQMAEFENFRKRTDREKSQMFDTGAAHVIEKLLPVVDNFERGLASAPENEENKAFAEGMQMIYKQLSKMLEDLGVTPIEALGTEFDPNFHNAVMQTEATEEFPSGTVAQEMQKGYMYHDTVIRHSMVAVSE
ncbi:MAG: nucleotide exchange factor GrpE [Lachnospiraceae bacterium]|nr:nucleotide exchange factor GrpE [Lachnospiraceae bacterium]